MLGYDITWAGFNIIEVMSSAKFTYKRIGYLAASQSFHTDTEVRFLMISYLYLLFLVVNVNIVRYTKELKSVKAILNLFA